MKGNNKIHMNEATLIAAIQHYFNTMLFQPAQSPHVTGICQAEASNFLIFLEEQNETIKQGDK